MADLPAVKQSEAMLKRSSQFWIPQTLVLVVVIPLCAQETFELGNSGFAKIVSPDPQSPGGKLQAVRAARDIASEHPHEGAPQLPRKLNVFAHFGFLVAYLLPLLRSKGR